MKKTILIISTILLVTSLVLAMQPMPHAFEGKIIAQDSSSADGKTITAQLNGAVTATSKINGNSYKIVVIDNIGQGGIVKFFIGGEEAHEAYTFKGFEVTKTNLTFSTIPKETIGSCGDNICSVEECSFCAIDCSVSQCLNNNVCDSAIGEDEVTAPSDCSPPSSPSPTPSSSGSSGGGGGGGGSSTSSSSRGTESQVGTDQYNNSSQSSDSVNQSSALNSASGMSIGDLNENEDFVVEDVGKNRITGNFVQTLKNAGSKITGFVILVLAILVLIFTNKKKHKKKAESTSKNDVNKEPQ